MASRTSGAIPGFAVGTTIAGLLARIVQLERRVARLEAQRGQSLPGDFRFEPTPDGSGLVVRRVSTDGSEQVAGPL